MSQIDLLSERLQSKEAIKEMQYLALEIKAEQDKKERTKKEMLSNDDYIKWLKKFTHENGFTDRDWDYFPEKINDSDKENVNKLALLYEIISEYAQKEYIPSNISESNYGESYFLLCDGAVLEIGYVSGQGTLFYSRKVRALQSSQVKSYIVFDDIKNSKERINTHLIDDRLKALDRLLYLMSEDIPIEFIKAEVEKTLNEIELCKKQAEYVKR